MGYEAYLTEKRKPRGDFRSDAEFKIADCLPRNARTLGPGLQLK
jgi:hypothetical protein